MTEAAFLDFALTYMERQPFACFLDSAGPVQARASRMILSGQPSGLILQKGETWVFHSASECREVPMTREAFANWLSHFQSLNPDLGGPMLFPLLSYEAFLETSRAEKQHPIWPQVDAIWLLTENSYVFDRQKQTLYAPTQSLFADKVNDLPFPEGPSPTRPPLGWREDQRSYGQKIREVKRDIFEGNYYQANLSSRFLGTTQQNPLSTYQKMRAMNPSPFMGIFRWGSLWVLSGSPERLLAREGDMISTRPIAGTQPRFSDAVTNQRSIEKLTQSEKELAEHLMLVDLARNDLGKIAQPGSVCVPEFTVVESYSHVHHLVSQVEARIREDISPIDTIAALFPGGTITGAPKLACMEKLAQLEGEARGPYTGSFGYLDGRGNMDLNILIRTLIQRDELICFHAGGGIVADSEHDAEYLETRHKAAALMEALALQA